MSLWTGEFGDEYTRRNTVETLDARREMWRVLLPRDCFTIAEIGANIGLNLKAISEICDADLYATEPNDAARAQLNDVISPRHVRSDFADSLGWYDSSMDLVFTSGVLIHIPPDKLEASMREISRVARRYVICGEYFAPDVEMIPYRGHKDALWRRDYGSLFMDTCPDLHPIGTLFAWKRTTGLDNLTFWIFEKGPMRN